jgi:hypothetical protein
MLDERALARFVAKIQCDDATGCWLWTGALASHGYGNFGVAMGTTRYAHRLAYEQWRDAIPRGLVIDHLCRVRRCVNPWHMDVVSNRENILRGNGPAVQRARHRNQVRCVRGHDITGENVWRDARGYRHCRLCFRARRDEARASVDAR